MQFLQYFRITGIFLLSLVFTDSVVAQDSFNKKGSSFSDHPDGTGLTTCMGNVENVPAGLNGKDENVALTESPPAILMVAPALSGDLMFLHIKETGSYRYFSRLDIPPSVTLSPGVSFMISPGVEKRIRLDLDFFFSINYFRGEHVEEIPDSSITVYTEMLTKLTSYKASFSAKYIFPAGSWQPYISGGICFMHHLSQINRFLDEVQEGDFISTNENYLNFISKGLLGPQAGAGVFHPLFKKRLPFFLEISWEYLAGISSYKWIDVTTKTGIQMVHLRAGIYFNAY